MMSNNFLRSVRAIALILVLATIAITLHAQAPASLLEQLQAQYPLARGTNGCNVGNPETALVTQSAGGGMSILPVSSNVTITKCTNRYAEGKLKPPSSACNGEGISKAAGVMSHAPKIGGIFGGGKSKVDDQVSNQQMDVVKTGDTVYPVKLEVDASKGEVKFTIITCKQSGDQQNPYKGELIFNFKSLKPENVTQVEDTIAEVFKQGGGDQGNNGGQDQQQTGGGPAQQGGQDHSQDNQGPACNPEIGQTVDQVEGACGPPASQAKGAGTKKIYFYNQPKLKIIFVNGKVSDIE
jgi:hypothetical protein